MVLLSFSTFSEKLYLKATPTTILMPLSQLARVDNFCFNSLLPFRSILHILSFQAILFQILLYTLFPWFSWLTLLPFPGFFMLHNLTYLGVDVLIYGILTVDLCRWPWIIISSIFTITPTFSKKQHPIEQSHPTHHPDHRCLTPDNFALSTIGSSHVLQKYIKTTQTQH